LARAEGIGVVIPRQRRMRRDDGTGRALLHAKQRLNEREVNYKAPKLIGRVRTITLRDRVMDQQPSFSPAVVAPTYNNAATLRDGVRDETAPDYPSRSRAGRRVSNLFIRLESGVRVSDSQCGFRVYPLELFRTLRCHAGRYGFETEILTRAAWASCEVKEVAVSCRYAAEGEHVSHFRPWRDSFRAVGMHARLVGRALLPLPHKKMTQKPRSQQPRPHGSRVFRQFLNWINPARLVRDLRDQ